MTIYYNKQARNIMSAYKDVEKRKIYQREWARKNAIKKNDGSRIVISSPESTFIIQYHKMRKLKEDNKLTAFANWTINIRRMNEDYIERYGKYVNRNMEVEPIVESIVKPIVEPIVELAKPKVKIVKPKVIMPITDTFFECEDCKKKVRRNGRNGLHDLCPACFFDKPVSLRGKCLIALDSL